MLRGVRARGLKLTPQRIAIVREIANDPTHPTAQELYERLLPALPTMSFATVYNTLDALASAGLCSARALVPGAARFDPNMYPHDHAVCEACGLVRDVMPASGVRQAAARSSGAPHVPGFSVRSVEQIYRGLCDACARAATKAAVGSKRSAKGGSVRDGSVKVAEADATERAARRRSPPAGI
jgi:Fur family peroxide stress response transcriptional regulator